MSILPKSPSQFLKDGRISSIRIDTIVNRARMTLHFGRMPAKSRKQSDDSKPSKSVPMIRVVSPANAMVSHKSQIDLKLTIDEARVCLKQCKQSLTQVPSEQLSLSDSMTVEPPSEASPSPSILQVFEEFESRDSLAAMDARRSLIHTMAFISVYGLQGRHLLDAFLWALDDKHVPERADVTLALAHYWWITLPNQRSAHRIDRPLESDLNDPEVAAWMQSIRDRKPECPQDLMGLSPAGG